MLPDPSPRETPVCFTLQARDGVSFHRQLTPIKNKHYSLFWSMGKVKEKDILWACGQDVLFVLQTGMPCLLHAFFLFTPQILSMLFEACPAN